MQALLSRIAVAPPEPEAVSSLTGVSVDSSAFSSLSPSSRTPSQNATNAVLPPISTAVKTKITVAVECLQFATLLGERKQAMTGLSTLAQSFNARQQLNGHSDSRVEATVEEQELGATAVPAVLAALVSDPRDTELMETMLEFLHYIVSRAPAVALVLLTEPPEPAPWGMQTSLTLLQDPSPWIRGPAIALVRTLQDAQPRAFAKSVCECKEGLRRLLEVVEDRREHIRDAALAVLSQLTGQDKNAQHFLAFEEGFGRLFQIMEVEGLTEAGASDASTVIADCLQIVNNLVRDNLMTQTLFLEMPLLESHVPRILRLSGIEEDSEEIDTMTFTRRKRVLKLGLQLVRFLVAGLYEGRNEALLDEGAQRDQARKAQELARIQSLVARQEALMGAIGELVCASRDALTDLRLQAMDLLRLVSERNGGAQMILINLYAVPSGRNVLAELVHLDVGIESDESPVAAAASAFLDSLFEGNEGARMAVLQQIQTPPPPPSSAGVDGSSKESEASSLPLSAGRRLLDAFIVNIDNIAQCGDSTSVETLNLKLAVAWKASHRLASLLADSSYCKELALRVPAEYTDPQARVVPGGLFLSRCLRSIRSLSDEKKTPAVQSIFFQAKISLLVLLIRWCHGCPKAVREIVGSVSNLSVLVDTLSEQQVPVSQRRRSELTQFRGMIALLFGCCLEFLCEDEEEQALKLANTPIQAAGDIGLGSHMTRDELLQMMSKRLGLERFTDALVQFQQSPALLACSRVSKKQSSRVVLAHRAAYDVSDTTVLGEKSGGVEEAHYLFLLYERSFTVFYREMAERVQKRVIAIYTGVDTASSRASNVNSSTPNAMGAYQDLIRMQDKQIQDLKRQVYELKECQGGISNDNETMQTREQELINRLATQREQFEQDKADLESQNKALSQLIIEKETRLKGLTMTYEQLEREHQQCEQALAVARARVDELQSSLPLSNLNEELDTLRVALDTETNQRLRSEAAASESGASLQATRDRTDAELANVRLTMQLEDIRVESEQKDEQLAECNEMLEMLTQGQALVKTDNEKLKVQLAEAQAKSEQFGNASVVGAKHVVDNLMNENLQLKQRIDELESAARVAYERDQEVLQQRIQEVEQARRASPPVSEEVYDTLPHDDSLQTEVVSCEEAHEAHTDDRRMDELGSSQLEELKHLRALVDEMESVAKERETKIRQAAFLQDIVAGFDIQSRRDKEKYDATIRELEDELARAFLEKKDAKHKAKAAVKELEKEVARLFLAKVELEKEVALYQQTNGIDQTMNGNSGQESTKRSSNLKETNDSTVDDLLVLVASLEIQCSVLREILKHCHGEDAVAVAAELSRQRGAVVSV